MTGVLYTRSCSVVQSEMICIFGYSVRLLDTTWRKNCLFFFDCLRSCWEWKKLTTWVLLSSLWTHWNPFKISPKRKKTFTIFFSRIVTNLLIVFKIFDFESMWNLIILSCFWPRRKTWQMYLSAKFSYNPYLVANFCLQKLYQYSSLKSNFEITLSSNIRKQLEFFCYEMVNITLG